MSMLDPAHDNFRIDILNIIPEENEFSIEEGFEFNTYGDTYKEDYTINGEKF